MPNCLAQVVRVPHTCSESTTHTGHTAPCVNRKFQASHKYSKLVSMAGLDYFQLLFWLSDPLPETAFGDIMQNTILNDKFLCLVVSSSLLIVVASDWMLSTVKTDVDSLVVDFHKCCSLSE